MAVLGGPGADPSPNRGRHRPRARDRRLANPASAPAVLVAVVTVFCLLLFLCFEATGRSYEGHRRLTAARIMLLTVALAFAPCLRRASFASLALLVSIVTGVAGYAFTRLPERTDPRSTAAYASNCWNDFAAWVGEPKVPTQTDEPIWYPYRGRRPMFAAGHDGPLGVVLPGWPQFGTAGFAKMGRKHLLPGVAGTRGMLRGVRGAHGVSQPVACKIPQTSRTLLTRS